MKRFWLAMSMVVLSVAALAYVYLPPLWHEWLGVALGGIVLCHCAINYRWFCRLMGVGDEGVPVTKMRFTAWSVYQIVLNVLLIISFSVTMVTGILLSKYLFVDIVPYTWHRALWIYEWHTVAAWSLPIVFGLHMGLHGRILLWRCSALIQKMREFLGTKVSLSVVTNTEKKEWTKMVIGKSVRFLLMGGCIVGGLYGILANRLAERFLFVHVYSSPAADLPGEGYALVVVTMLGMYAIIGYWLGNYIVKNKSPHLKTHLP